MKKPRRDQKRSRKTYARTMEHRTCVVVVRLTPKEFAVLKKRAIKHRRAIGAELAAAFFPAP